MKRDTADGKINWLLVRPGPMLRRWAALMTRGSVKYESDREPGELRNWQKARGIAELERFRESAARHFEQWLDGDLDEDHAAGVIFNINGAEYVQELLDAQLTIASEPGPCVLRGFESAGRCAAAACSDRCSFA